MISNKENKSLEPDWLVNCVSVDIETAGPYPGEYAMLSVGACRVTDQQETFYVELKPDRKNYQEHALSISGLSMDDLERNGIQPEQAMRFFATWLSDVVPDKPIFIAFNASFDWMFINDYFHRYYGTNPFGHSAIDIKALFLGLSASAWKDTSMDAINLHLGFEKTLSHHALEDAIDQAHLFTEIIKRIREHPQKE